MAILNAVVVTLFCTMAMAISPHSDSILSFQEGTASKEDLSFVENTITAAPAPR